MQTTMQPHQERAVTEKKELDRKLEKLTAFFSGGIFPTLPLGEKSRLERQARIMQEYSDVLGERIAAF